MDTGQLPMALALENAGRLTMGLIAHSAPRDPRDPVFAESGTDVSKLAFARR
jgi:hypothetical protein